MNATEPSTDPSPGLCHCRVVYIAHFLWPVHVKILELVQSKVRSLSVLVSSLSERNRPWLPAFGALHVIQQRSFVLTSTWRHPLGFSYTDYRHLPFDTYSKVSAARPGVILSTHLGLASILAALYRAIHPQCRWIPYLQLTAHQQLGAGFVRRAVRKILLKYADWIIVNGHDALQYAVSFGASKDRISVLPNVIEGCAFEQMQPASGWNRIRRLLYVGRLVEGKGLLQLLGALDDVVRRQKELVVQMTFVGYGPLAQSLKDARTSERLQVICQGPVAWDERRQAYTNGQVFVFPTHSDDWGNVVNEASAAGLPVCGSKYSQAVTELVKPGFNGWIFDPLDASSFRQALTDMLFSTESRIRQMSDEARRLVRPLTPEFAARRMCEAICAVCPSQCATHADQSTFT